MTHLELPQTILCPLSACVKKKVKLFDAIFWQPSIYTPTEDLISQSDAKKSYQNSYQTKHLYAE